MTIPSAIEILRRTYFLRDLDEEELHTLVPHLQREDHDSGYLIAQQGAPPDSLCFIAEGEVQIVRQDRNSRQQILATLVAGDMLGEIEIIFPRPILASMRTIQPTTIYRWDRESLMAFLKSHPDALARLRFAAESRRLAQKAQFNWLGENEVIYGLARKHSMLLYQALTWPILLLLGAVGLGWWAYANENPFGKWCAVATGVLSIALAIWQLVDWGNDYYILTNRRAIWLEKIVGIYNRRREAPLHWVLSVSVSTDMTSRMMGYGNVTIRTYTGEIVFRNVNNPQAMADMIEDHWQRIRSKRKQSDRDTMVESLTQRLQELGEGQEPTEVKPAETKPLHPQAESGHIGLDHWTLEMRFEEKGVITYRKHWAVLVRQILIPSLLFLLAVGMIGARLSNLLEIGSRTGFSFAAAIVAISMALWWVYSYVDWANDIYQITPTHIVDVYKKPLAREIRKIAPLENVLGSEVDQKGITGLLLNYGNLIANVGSTEFAFEGIYDPAGVQQDIAQTQDALFERMKDVEHHQRQDEMVEWLSAYHHEIATLKDRKQAGRGENNATS